MEGSDLEHFNKYEPSTVPRIKFNSCLSDESGQYSSTTATHLFILLILLLSNGFIT